MILLNNNNSLNDQQLQKNDQQQISIQKISSPQQQQYISSTLQQEERKSKTVIKVYKNVLKLHNLFLLNNVNQDSQHGLQDHSFNIDTAMKGDDKQNSQVLQQHQEYNQTIQISNQNENQTQDNNQQFIGQNNQNQKQSKQDLNISDNKGRNIPSMRNIKQEEGTQIAKQIEEKLQQIQSTLNKVKFGLFKKMTAAQSIYDVDIYEYKLIDFPLNQTVFPKLNGEDEKQIFQQLYILQFHKVSWQKEIYKIKHEGAASQVVSSSDDEDGN